MTDDPDTRPKLNDQKSREQARRARALRENLRRRKAQARGRAMPEAPDQGPETHDSAGIGDDKHTG